MSISSFFYYLFRVISKALAMHVLAYCMSNSAMNTKSFLTYVEITAIRVCCFYLYRMLCFCLCLAAFDRWHIFHKSGCVVCFICDFHVFSQPMHSSLGFPSCFRISLSQSTYLTSIWHSYTALNLL